MLTVKAFSHLQAKSQRRSTEASDGRTAKDLQDVLAGGKSIMNIAVVVRVRSTDVNTVHILRIGSTGDLVSVQLVPIPILATNSQDQRTTPRKNRRA